MSNPFADLKPIPVQDGLTYDQWRANGYQVMRGEKATGRNGDGVPTFTEDQVVEEGIDDDDAREQWARSEPWGSR
jgi:hypothetical protein